MAEDRTATGTSPPSRAYAAAISAAISSGTGCGYDEVASTGCESVLSGEVVAGLGQLGKDVRQGVADRLPIGRRRHAETGRHRELGPEQDAEVPGLAADLGQVLGRREFEDVRHERQAYERCAPTAIRHPARARVASSGVTPESELTYPPTRRGDVVETLHGRSIADPYRWLEDPDSPETIAWVAAQNAVTEDYLAALPQRDWFAETMTAILRRPRTGVPFVRGGRCLVTRNDGRQDQDVWFVADSLAELLDGGRVLIDPNTFSAGGTDSVG